MRLFIYANYVLNVDNLLDAKKIIEDKNTTRELSEEEINGIFGGYAHLAGPDTTMVKEDGSICFTLPEEYKKLEVWVSTFVRPERDRRLATCDKYMISDYPISAAEKKEWKDYRKKLRDLPETINKIGAVSWPEKPGE